MQSTEPWPNLFVPGASKSGTSSLHRYLQQHPDIWMSEEKEPVFFNRTERYQSRKSQQYYLSLFNKGKDKRYRGESSTDYMQSVDAVQRIKETATNPKFIFILRNPIDRAFSHFTWLKGIGQETRTFEEAFLSSHQQFMSRLCDQPSYYSEGLYYTWISRYFDVFGNENVHLLLFENLKSNTLASLNSCFVFLGLSPLNHVEIRHENKSIMLKSPFYGKMIVLLSSESDNIYKHLYRFVFPDRLRIYVRRRLIHALNHFKYKMGSQTVAPHLDNNLRKWVGDFYQDEVRKLREITNLNLHLWEDFQ